MRALPSALDLLENNLLNRELFFGSQHKEWTMAHICKEDLSVPIVNRKLSLSEIATIFALLGARPRLEYLYMLLSGVDQTLPQAAKAIKIPITGLRWHLDHLTTNGILSKVRSGRSNIFQVSDQARERIVEALLILLEKITGQAYEPVNKK